MAITPYMAWTPALELCETDSGCRLTIGGYNFARVLGRPSIDELSFVWELGEIAAGGGDIRPRVFGLD